MISQAEGMEQEILRIEGGQVYSRAVLSPGAEGPPVHWHAGFDEIFRVAEGTLHVEVGGEVRQLGPGETLKIPAGTSHRPFNPGAHRVLLDHPGQPSFPAEFAACLGQLYGFMDERSSRKPGPSLLPQMAVFQSVCDTHAMPVVVERAASLLVAPTARLFGLKNYYPGYSERAIVRR